MMPPYQIHFQLLQHLVYLICAGSVVVLEGDFGAYESILEVCNQKEVVGVGRGVCRVCVGELSGQHRV